MLVMLKNDGKYEFFIIEYKKNVKPGIDSRPWKLLNSVSKLNWGHRWENGKQLEPYATFSNGMKDIGVQGFYDSEKALTLYLILMRLNKDYMFQIVKKTIWQDSESLWCGQHWEKPTLQTENS